MTTIDLFACEHCKGVTPPPGKRCPKCGAHTPMVHTCHWPGCTAPVPPKMWGCAPHWFRLPHFLRAAVWRHYVPGQEITKTPSVKYLVVAGLVQAWINLATDLVDGLPISKTDLAIATAALETSMKEGGL